MLKERLPMIRILIVEDDTDLLRWLKFFLTSKGYWVTTASTCREALDLVEKAVPDVILLEVTVGDEDGRNTCLEIKKRKNFETIPVILISADHEQLRAYNEYNATSFLEKPFSAQKLADLLDGLNLPVHTRSTGK